MTAFVNIQDVKQGGKRMSKCERNVSLTIDEYSVIRDLIGFLELPFEIRSELLKPVALTYLKSGNCQQYNMMCMVIEFEEKDSCLLSMLQFFTKEIVKNENAKRTKTPTI